MEGFFSKPMRSVFVSFNLSQRPLLGGKFRYVLGFKELNGCELTKIMTGNPMLKPLIEFANSTLLKGIIRQCPYGPGYVRVENASISLTSVNGFGRTQSMPDGDYKIDIRLFNKKDENVLTMSVITQSSWRLNKILGNEKV